MKVAISKCVNSLVMLVMGMLVSMYSFAQNAGRQVEMDITTTTTETATWYSNPWVWIIGAAVFILLFAAILRGNRTDA